MAPLPVQASIWVMRKTQRVVYLMDLRLSVAISCIAYWLMASSGFNIKISVETL